MEEVVARALANLLADPGYTLLLKRLEGYVEELEKRLLAAREPDEVLNIHRHWAVSRTLYEEFSKRPNDAVERLRNFELLPV